MTRRLRVAHVLVQPVLMWDDGEELTPGPIAAPIELPLSKLASLADAMPAELARLEAQVKAAAAPAAPPDGMSVHLSEPGDPTPI